MSENFKNIKRKSIKPILALFSVMIVLIIGWYFTFNLIDFKTECNINIIERAESPDNLLTIFVYEKDCGKIAGTSLNISISGNDSQDELKRGLVLSVRNNSDEDNDSLFSVKWLSESIANIKYKKSIIIHRKRENIKHITIIFEEY